MQERYVTEATLLWLLSGGPEKQAIFIVSLSWAGMRK